MIQKGKNSGRLFIDVTKEGCPCGCAYCYVRHVAGNETLVDKRKIVKLQKQLIKRIDFVPGPHGTLLTFGSHSDLFRTTTMFNRLLLALKTVVPLGNPMQISTKQLIDEKRAAKIATIRTYKTQITVFISCSTIRQSAQYEPGSVFPEKRFSSFTPLHNWEIPNCLYIKPFLPGITDQEAPDFIKIIRAIKPDSVCVGSLYTNKQIIKRLKLSRYLKNSKDRQHPLMKNSTGTIDPPSKFINQLKTALPKYFIFKNSVCVVAYINNIHCPTHVWEHFPKLCIRCRNCKSLLS